MRVINNRHHRDDDALTARDIQSGETFRYMTQSSPDNIYVMSSEFTAIRLTDGKVFRDVKPESRVVLIDGQFRYNG